MPAAEAVIRTEHPDKYLTRLGKHASKMRQHLATGHAATTAPRRPPKYSMPNGPAVTGPSA